MLVVIRIKKIFKIVCVCAIMIVFLLCFAAKEEKDMIQTFNGNNKKIVILDAGHGLPDRTEP